MSSQKTKPDLDTRDQEDIRYSRQKLIQGWDQEKIRAGKVLIVGVGALGSIVAVALAMQGVGRILIVDPDTVELSNLSRQLLFKDTDVGRPKAEAGSEAIRAINSQVDVQYFAGRIEDVPDRTIRDYDVIVDSLDNFDVRRWINSVAVNLGVPLVSGGLFGFYGNVQVVIPNQTPCLECQPLLPAHRLQKACTPLGEVRKAQASEAVDEKIPSVASVSITIGGIMAQECTKILLGRQDAVIRDFLFWDGFSEVFTRLPLQRRAECVVCSDRFRIKGIPFVISPKETLEELKGRISVQFGGEAPTILKGSLVLKEHSRLLGEILKDNDVLHVVSKDLPAPLKLQVILSQGE